MLAWSLRIFALLDASDAAADSPVAEPPDVPEAPDPFDPVDEADRLEPAVLDVEPELGTELAAEPEDEPAELVLEPALAVAVGAAPLGEPETPPVGFEPVAPEPADELDIAWASCCCALVSAAA